MRIALLLTAGMLLAQEQPLVRVDTQMVEVDVVVRDGHGPVSNLTKDDFTIFDEGRQQKVAVFSVRTGNTAPPGVLPNQPGAISNRVNANSTTVFLFDSLNTDDQTGFFGPPVVPQSFMRLEAVKYLHTAEKGDQYAVYTLAKSLRVVEDFTDDIPRVTRAVESVKIEHSFDKGAEDFAVELADQQKGHLKSSAATAGPLATERAHMLDSALASRATITAQALEAIAKHLQGQPGRKKLVWLSSSFPAMSIGAHGIPQDYGNEIQYAVRALNDANIAVYPIDPRDPLHYGRSAPGVDTMNLIADGTGGKAAYGITDLAGAIRDAVHDSEVTYALGFYPEDVKLDGSYHALSVKVARKGVEVRARKGYYAAAQKILTEKERRDSMREILDSALDATGIGLAARVEPVPNKADAYDLFLTFDLSQIHLDREGDRWVATIDFLTYFPQAKKPNGEDQALKITLTERSLREALASGYTLHRAWNAQPPARGDLRLVVQDRTTGAAGSIRLRVPPI